MLTQELKLLFTRDLEVLKNEISLFDTEDLIWSTAGNVLNSPGHLCFHLCGNLRHYIGHILTGSDYKRNRPHEFEGPAVNKQTLIQLIDQTIEELNRAFSTIKEDQLHLEFPIQVFEKASSTSHFLLHLYGHFSYHLGQINYYRRLK